MADRLDTLQGAFEDLNVPGGVSCEDEVVMPEERTVPFCAFVRQHAERELTAARKLDYL